jgi:hypothetical protein
MAFPIFDKLGGSEAALEVIAESFGVRPTKFVQDKWRAKRQLPSKLHLPLIEACLRKGASWSRTDFEWHEEDRREEASA